MEEDKKLEELQRSIDALLEKIEAQKDTIGWLLRDSGPIVCAVARGTVAPWKALASRSLGAMLSER